METYTISTSGCYTIHDSWTETLAGAKYLIGIIEKDRKIGDKAHLCRLVLISSLHMIEKLFFDCAIEVINKDPEKYQSLKNKFKDVSLAKAMEE
ncbi:MAG: hypothetical protein ACUZ8E_01615 [Candidatus Anammoxibacter sp.]